MMMVFGFYSVAGIIGLALAIVILIGAAEDEETPKLRICDDCGDHCHDPVLFDVLAVRASVRHLGVVVLGDSSVKAAFRS